MLSKAKYRDRLPHWRSTLYDRQKACWDGGIPWVIVFER